MQTLAIDGIVVLPPEQQLGLWQLLLFGDD
jgi:hypothetical protein